MIPLVCLLDNISNLDIFQQDDAGAAPTQTGGFRP